jgi:hypothetical protein
MIFILNDIKEKGSNMVAPFDIAQELLKHQLTSSNHYTLQIELPLHYRCIL